MQTEGKVSSSRLRGESLKGKTFGWLKVIAPAERPPDARCKMRGTWWLCRCRCGQEKVVARNYLVQNNVTSCGCLKKGRKTKEPVKIASSYARLATECTCAACQKPFERLSEQWAYKATVGTKLRWFCSWRCLRSATRKDQPEAAQA